VDAPRRSDSSEDPRTSDDLLALLVAALEAIPAAAFVLRADGVLFASNEAGRAWLAHEGRRQRGLRAALREAPEAPPTDLAITRVGDSGAILVVHRPAPRRSVAAVARDWKLTPRERHILPHLLDGRSNRAIATALAITPRTVESHLTSMFKKAGVESRAELVALVWG
jgi:DNA-binding CsgD family transcriptional regulator